MGNKVADVLKEFDKTYGEKASMHGDETADVRRIPTGIFALDLAMGGGFPEGKISIVFGPESSGKTNLVFITIALYQKLHPERVCAFVDVEHAFDKKWAKKLGIDTKKLIVIKPAYAEQAVDQIEALLFAEDIGLVVVDSLAAMIPVNEMENSADRVQVAGNAIPVTKLMTKTILAQTECAKRGHYPTLICINQLRMQIGKMHGNPEKMPGGWAMKHNSSMTLRVYGKDIMVSTVSKKLPAMKGTTVGIKKNKVPVASKKAEYEMALIAHNNLPVGGAKSWNTVVAYLKSFGLLEQSGKKGWNLTMPTTGEILEFDKQDDIRLWLEQNPEEDYDLKQALISMAVEVENGDE